MGCVMSSSRSSEKKKGRPGGSRRQPSRCFPRRQHGRRRSAVTINDQHEEFHDRCHTIIVPKLVGGGGGGSGPGGGYYHAGNTTSFYESSDDSSSVVAFAPWKGHRFVGQHQPNSPAMVSDSWSFAVGSPAASLGSPVMFSEVWSKQGKRASGGGGGNNNHYHHQPAVIDEEATEIELESEGEVSPFVMDYSSSPERGMKGINDVGVFARRRKNGSLSDPTFMEAFIFA